MTTMGKDEVEEMLREAEDDLLLKLTRDSHTVAGTSSTCTPLDADLARRFEALKSAATAKNRTPVSSSSSSTIDDDLTARFAALKTGKSGAPPGDLPPPNAICSQDPPLPPPPRQQVPEKDDDEVESVMRWAMDAVRLGTPDPTGTTSSDDEDEDEDEDGDAEDEDLKERCQKKEGDPAVDKSKKHGKEVKKWIFF